VDPDHLAGDPEPPALVAETARSGGPPWTLSDPLVAYLASVMLAIVVGSIWIGVTGEEEVTLGLTVTTLFAQWTGMLGGTVLASRRRGTGRLAADVGLRVERRDILPGIAAGVLSQLVLLPLLYIPMSFLIDDLDISEEARELTGLGSGAGLVLLSVMIVVGAPLVEEIFFRGLLQQSLTRRFGPGWALGGSAVLFGLTHFQPLLLPGLIAFGVVLGLLARRSGRLGPAVIAHMAFNAVTVIALTASRA
jgi:uncharacterized protein